MADLLDVTADEFLTLDQSRFGDAWRYELVENRVVALETPSPDHGAILAGLAGALGSRLKGQRDCRPESGSGAIPRYKPRHTARIPDAMVRCAGAPRAIFEILSSADLSRRRIWDRRRRDLQAVQGVQEIVGLLMDGLAHIYRRRGQAWVFEAIDGLDATLTLDSIGLAIPLAEIYAFVEIPPEDAEQIG